MSLLTAVFWRESAIGIAALSLMCGGDGLADIIGRRFGGENRLPFNRAKSWAGSIAMFVGGVVFTIGFTMLFHQWGFMTVTAPWQLLRGVVLVSFVATFVEALPANQFIDDNISVPIGALLAGLAFL